MAFLLFLQIHPAARVFHVERLSAETDFKEFTRLVMSMTLGLDNWSEKRPFDNHKFPYVFCALA